MYHVSTSHDASCIGLREMVNVSQMRILPDCQLLYLISPFVFVCASSVCRLAPPPGCSVCVNNYLIPRIPTDMTDWEVSNDIRL